VIHVDGQTITLTNKAYRSEKDLAMVDNGGGGGLLKPRFTGVDVVFP
jgi:hypothetical protein